MLKEILLVATGLIVCGVAGALVVILLIEYIALGAR